MNTKGFMQLRATLNADCEKILDGKGRAYSGNKDYLANFKRLAKTLGVKPEFVWYVYFQKHVDAIASYVRGEYSDTEGIEGRIADVRNYADLLYALINENKTIEGASKCYVDINEQVSKIGCMDET